LAALQPVRGTHDLLPEEEWRHRHIAETARAVAERYGFLAMATPIFEFTGVFSRSIGETSDIVSKEMYSFADRSGDHITLRPENTAGVVRALISNGLTQSLPQKFFYYGPMFRHERPQKGRLRQFHQTGVELIGVATPLADVEVVACGADFLDALGLLDRTRLDLNTLGDQESRQAYRAVLVGYFADLNDQLSEDSRRRLESNPLRILDSKDEGDRALIAGAPSYADHLNAASQDFFGAVKSGLDRLGIAYHVEPRLVRGLDYYCHTAFEFVADELGAQSTVLAGGRYDGLVQTMGGPEVPGVGWASGVERVALMLGTVPPRPRPVVMVPLGEAAEAAALPLTHALRRAGIPVELGFTGNLKRRLARADKIGARIAVILGDNELAKGVAVLRDLDAGSQTELPLGEVVLHLTREAAR
jgi:histidyl-tRNA synthetase